MRWVQAPKELTLSVLKDVSRRISRNGLPTRRQEVLKAPRRIYRLPPLPPTSPARDVSKMLERFADAIVALGIEIQTSHVCRLGFLRVTL